MTEKDDADEIDMVAYDPEVSDEEPFNMAINDSSENPTIILGKLVTTACTQMMYVFQLRR